MVWAPCIGKRCIAQCQATPLIFTIPFFCKFVFPPLSFPSLGAQCPPRRVVSTSSWRVTFVSSLSFVGKRGEKKKYNHHPPPTRKTCTLARIHLVMYWPEVCRGAVNRTTHCDVPLHFTLYCTAMLSNLLYQSNRICFYILLTTPSPSHRA